MNFILGGKILISEILFERLPMILIPTHIPHRNIVANENTTATINTSTVWNNHAGRDLMNGKMTVSNIML